MDNGSVVQPPPYAVFRCKMDKRQFILPGIFLCIFGAVILFMASDIGWGMLGFVFGMTPLVAVLFVNWHLWSNVTYTINGKVLRVSGSFNKSVAINIDSIKKIRRGKFWVERGRNYSASYVKFRIVYDRSSYIYVSPEDEVAFVGMLRTINPNIAYSSERGL